MVLKFYGHHLSGHSKRAALVLLEKQIPFEYVTIDLMAGEHQTEGYAKIHPFQQVPYIDDDGYILYESRAISRYICAKYPNQGAKLIPSSESPQVLGLFEQAASVEFANFDPPACSLYFETVTKKHLGMETDDTVVAKSTEKLKKVLDIYEKILGKQLYLAGNEISLVDLWHIPVLALICPKEVSERPNVSRWLSDISSRKSWQTLKDGISSVEKY